MDEEIIGGLIYNASILLSISILYNSLFLKYEKSNALKKALAGAIVGFLGILLIQVPVTLAPGIIFDTRSILVSVSAMFFGFIPVVIADAIIIVWRIIVGGSGALMGVLVTILASCIGLAWNKMRLEQILTRRKNIFAEFYIVGLITHTVMLICELALPRDAISLVFQKSVMPILLVYPVVSLLLSLILYNGFINYKTRLELEESEARYKYLYHEHQNKQTLLKTLINSVPDLIFYKDINGAYIGCNSAFEKFAGRKESEIVGRTDFELFDKDAAELFKAMDRDMLLKGKSTINEEVVTYPDGTDVYLETLKTPYSDEKGDNLGLIGISRDISERKKREKEILYLTYHDALTGLYNRAFFEAERKRLDTKRQLPLSVIVGDINGLKLINDAFGHDEGDRLLVEVAKILRLCIRTEDIVARIGGDEFCILLPQTDINDAKAIVDRINRKCEEYINEANRETYYASISLGYATKLKAEEPFEKVFRVAEEFMYKLKLLEYKSIHSSIITTIKSTLYEKSNETKAHAARLAQLSNKLGTALGLDSEQLTKLDLLSALHDIGKISIADSILAKPGSLTEGEMFEIRKHPEIGYRIAQASPELRNISEYILSHHERWDGKGYPQGLSGESIPLLSRILAIVDAYDAMTEDRVYRKAMTSEEALAEIRNNAGTQFDPAIAEAFMGVVSSSD